MRRSDLSSLIRRIKENAASLESFDDSYRALTEDYHYNFDMVACSDQFAYTAESKKPGSFTLCLLYTSPSPRDGTKSRMPSSA